MGLKERNVAVGAKPLAESLDLWFLLDDRWISIFYKNSIRQFCSDTFKLPEDVLFTSVDFDSVIGLCAKIWWAFHVEDSLEELDPWVKVTSLHEIGAHLKLVADVKDLANKMKHMESISIVLVLHHLAHQ